jgi:Domain of unknown function (DUF932)
MLDAELGISSAGLLKDGAIAWVEIGMPDSITTPERVTFRPNVLAATSSDGSIATTFERTITDTVCDNTGRRRSVRKARSTRSSTAATASCASPRPRGRWP